MSIVFRSEFTATRELVLERELKMLKLAGAARKGTRPIGPVEEWYYAHAIEGLEISPFIAYIQFKPMCREQVIFKEKIFGSALLVICNRVEVSVNYAPEVSAFTVDDVEVTEEDKGKEVCLDKGITVVIPNEDEVSILASLPRRPVTQYLMYRFRRVRGARLVKFENLPCDCGGHCGVILRCPVIRTVRNFVIETSIICSRNITNRELWSYLLCHIAVFYDIRDVNVHEVEGDFGSAVEWFEGIKYQLIPSGPSNEYFNKECVGYFYDPMLLGFTRVLVYRDFRGFYVEYKDNSSLRSMSYSAYKQRFKKYATVFYSLDEVMRDIHINTILLRVVDGVVAVWSTPETVFLKDSTCIDGQWSVDKQFYFIQRITASVLSISVGVDEYNEEVINAEMVEPRPSSAYIIYLRCFGPKSHLPYAIIPHDLYERMRKKLDMD
jgi:hypothetical protein